MGQCDALRLAQAAASRFPRCVVRVVDLEREPQARPEGLVAVPTYLLNEEVLFLGNPRQTELIEHLRRSLAGSEAGDGPS